jgi:ATP-dependent helicase HrpA
VLAAEIASRFRVAIDPAVWADKPLPDHLRVRVRVVDANAREIVASRELAEVRAVLLAQSREASIAIAREEPAAWRSARATWETPEFATWTFDALPERVLIAEQSGAPVYAFPGLLAGTAGVARRLFRTPEEATAATRRAISALLERQLGHDLMWTQRDLRSLRSMGPLAAILGPISIGRAPTPPGASAGGERSPRPTSETLEEQAFHSIRAWAIDWRRIGDKDRGRPKPPAEPSDAARRDASPYHTELTAANFAAAVAQAKEDLRGLVPRFVDLVREILTLRQEVLVVADPPAGLTAHVEALVPADFLARTPYEQLSHFPRYLKAMKLRAERWRKNPGKDADRAAQIAPYENALRQLQREKTSADTTDALRWLIEEFRVSLFAQELGTAQPVSAVKLDRAIATARQGPAAEPAAATAPKPIVAAPVADKAKKTAPLKNLGALDKLFGR